MGADEFIEVLGEKEVADLASCFEGAEGSQGQRVPEADAPVSCAATTGEEAVLVGRPGDGFDGCDVVSELDLGTRAVVDAPDEEFVVIAP